jgi:UDP-N-acetylmuramoyl-tripeptide--D-alanyl-D-alanine ligase
MDIENLYKLFLENPKISIDTRTMEPGSIFWAIKGENFNGNIFIESAIEKGAAYAVTDDKEYINNKKFIYVEDSLKTLQNLANYHRIKLNIPIIGITGTNGKTTTKELIASVLEKKFIIGYTQGNLNNQIGVPLTLLSFNKKTEIGIVEMGANHIEDIKELCEIALPDFGIITNIGKAHLQGFGSVEGVIKAKRELYISVERKKGTIFFNSDNEILKKILPNTKLISYGLSNENTCFGNIIENSIFLEMEILTKNKKCFNLKTKLYGNYNYENVLAASTIGNFFGVKDNLIKEALENYTPQNNRSQVLKTENNTLILDAYNANPSSMKKALESFIASKMKNKIMILGDMLELGKETEIEHKTIVDIIEKNINSFDKIFLTGTEFKKVVNSNIINVKIIAFNKVEDIVKKLKTEKITNSNILIKGSRGIKLEKVIDSL